MIDILVFTDGKASSLVVVLNVVNQFARRSGLHINVAKSSLYQAGPSKHTAQQAEEAWGLSVGNCWDRIASSHKAHQSAGLARQS